MAVKIIYDDQDYNIGIVYVNGTSHEYSYDTDIKEFIISILDELSVDYETKAFNFVEEE